MSHLHCTTRHAARQRGQSTIEYTVICTILAASLFLAATPVGQQLADAFHAFYADLTFFLSLP